VLFFGLLSLVIAVPASAYAAYQICASVVDIMNSKLTVDTQVPLIPSVILLQAFVSLLVPVVAAFFPILKGSRVSVEQALSGELISQSDKQTIFDRWLDKLQAIKGILLLSLRNTFRQPQRLFLTIFTLALGGSIFIAVFNVEVSLDEQIDRILNYSSADIYLDLERDYNIEEVERLLYSVPGVTYIEYWLGTNAQIDLNGQPETVSVLGPPDDSQLVDPVVQFGRWVKPDERNALVVNDAFWNIYPELAPGDQIELTINNQEETWTVVGIFHYSGLDTKVGYTNLATLESHLNEYTRATNFRIVTEHHDLAYQLAKADEIDSRFRDRGFAVAAVTAVEDRLQNLTEKLDIVIYVLLVLAVLTGLVGSIGLSGMLGLNVLERTSEIGILRAIGGYNQVVARLVLFEGMVVGVVSYIIGALISFPITKILADVINLAIFKAPAEYTITPRGFLIWLLTVLVMSLFASLFPARNATRLTIREVLAYE
jgi:putative ABC transport system permease protein